MIKVNEKSLVFGGKAADVRETGRLLAEEGELVGDFQKQALRGSKTGAVKGVPRGDQNLSDNTE